MLKCHLPWSVRSSVRRLVSHTFSDFHPVSALTKRRDDIVVADMVPDMVADMKVDTGHGGRHGAGQGGRLLFLALGGVGLSQFAASKIRFPNVSQMLLAK